MRTEKNLLLIKGFELNKYEDGKVKVYELVKHAGVEGFEDMCKAFQFNPIYVTEIIIAQCTDKFENCLVYADGDVYNLTQVNFMDIVRKL